MDAERSLARSVAKGMAAAIPLMVASLMALVAIAVGRQHPDWGSWLGMAAGIGVLAGVFFGMWVGFVANAHAFDEADLPSRPRFANSRHQRTGRPGHP